MRLSLPTHVAAAAVIAGSAVGLLAGPAAASTTLGQVGSDPNVLPCHQCSEIQGSSSGARPSYTVPQDGVITSWTFHALGAGGTARLRVFGPIGKIIAPRQGGPPPPPPVDTLLAESANESFVLGETKTSPTRIPVKRPDHLGIAVDGPSGFTFSGDPLDSAAEFPYAAPVGDHEPLILFAGYRVAVSATLEPDADQDGYGDETQDQCPTDPTTHAACAAGSQPAGSAGDTTPPRLTVAGPAKESVRKGRVYLFATSSKTVAGAANGKVSVPKLAKRYRLRPATRTLSANTRTKITLKMPRKALRAVRSALARHQRVMASLVVRVKDSAGTAASKSLKLRLIK